MPLTEADYEDLRAQKNADPERFRDWDPTDSFSKNYAKLHPENQSQIEEAGPSDENRIPQDEVEQLERASTASSSEVASAPQYEGIRARSSGNRARANSGYSHDTGLYRSVTEEINGVLERHPTAIERIGTHRTQHFGTVGSYASSRRSKKDKTLPKFGGGKPYPPSLPAKEEYVVEFDGHEDPLHAQNWPFKKKLYISVIVMWTSLGATFGSSIFSPAATGMDAEFHVGIEVGTLGTSLFVLGYAFGPILWAPFSELYGRRLPIVIGAFGFGTFAIGVATAENIQTVMICRFFNGLFGSCPLAVVAAIFADMYSNETRGLAVACFSATVFMGPLLAPFVGGFITISYLGWRWTEYISAIMGYTAFLLTFFFLPETYAPVILVGKAAELRRLTKNWGIHAKQEEIEIDVKELIVKNVGRPLRILFTEPIVLLVTIYMSFLYGLLYLFLTAYALVFQEVYGFNAGVGGLPYFGMVIGELIAFIVVVLMNPAYVRKLKENNNIPVPEWRLPLVMVGGIVFAIGLFWFGWTGYTGRIHWIVPTLSGLCTGFGIFAVFLQLLNYIIDAYLMFAASAIAGNTFMRSIFGAVFPLFARYMYVGIGIQWGNTLIGCVALLLVPLPFIFYFMGKKIRARSTFAPAPDIEQDKKRDEEKNVEGRGEANASVPAPDVEQDKKIDEEKNVQGKGEANESAPA